MSQGRSGQTGESRSRCGGAASLLLLPQVPGRGRGRGLGRTGSPPGSFEGVEEGEGWGTSFKPLLLPAFLLRFRDLGGGEEGSAGVVGAVPRERLNSSPLPGLRVNCSQAPPARESFPRLSRRFRFSSGVDHMWVFYVYCCDDLLPSSKHFHYCDSKFLRNDCLECG